MLDTLHRISHLGVQHYEVDIVSSTETKTVAHREI